MRKGRGMKRACHWVWRRAFSAVVVAAVGVLVMGCVTVTPPETAEFPEAEEVRVVLQPGDSLQVRFAYWPELDTQQSIRPDGKIALQLVGEVTAGGLTPEEVRAELLSLYADKLIDPEITIVVASLAGQRVYVGGEVLVPGLVAMQGRLTALEAIMQAGGFKKESAKLATVVVIRRRDDKQYARSLNLRKALEEPSSEPFFLEPFDVVYVPRTNIDRLDQFVDQYINQIIPDSVYASFNYSRTSNVDSVDSNTQTSPVQLVLP